MLLPLPGVRLPFAIAREGMGSSSACQLRSAEGTIVQARLSRLTEAPVPHAPGCNSMCNGRRQAALDLGEEQKQRLLAARTYLLAQMVEIIQERTLIISMLQVRHCGPAWSGEELQDR